MLKKGRLADFAWSEMIGQAHEDGAEQAWPNLDGTERLVSTMAAYADYS